MPKAPCCLALVRCRLPLVCALDLVWTTALGAPTCVFPEGSRPRVDPGLCGAAQVKMADWNKLAKYMPTGVFLTFQSLVTLTTHKPDASGCVPAAALLHCHAVCPFLPVIASALLTLALADLVWPMPLMRAWYPAFLAACLATGACDKGCAVHQPHKEPAHAATVPQQWPM